MLQSDSSGDSVTGLSKQRRQTDFLGCTRVLVFQCFVVYQASCFGCFVIIKVVFTNKNACILNLYHYILNIYYKLMTVVVTAFVFSYLCSTEYITEEPRHFTARLTTEIIEITLDTCWIWHTLYRIWIAFHFCFVLKGLLPNPKQSPFFAFSLLRLWLLSQECCFTLLTLSRDTWWCRYGPANSENYLLDF